MPEGPWKRVSGEICGPLKDSSYWFITICEYSRWAAVDVIKSTAFEDFEPSLEKLFSIFGAPAEFKTDNGSPFQSYKFAAFAEKWGLKHRKVTPLWPRANGEVERFMRNLGKVIRNARMSGTNKYVKLQKFLRAYRNTPHLTTGVAPAALMMGGVGMSGLPKPKFEASEPNPYSITKINGSMITAKGNEQSITRNSSFFKRYFIESDDEKAKICAIKMVKENLNKSLSL